jgi:hypothetical protein
MELMKKWSNLEQEVDKEVKGQRREVRIGRKHRRAYPKVSGLSHNEIKQQQQQTLVEKQHKGLQRQNSLD